MLYSGLSGFMALGNTGMKPEHEKCGTSTFDIIVQDVCCPAQKEAQWKTAFTDLSHCWKGALGAGLVHSRCCYKMP